MRLLINKEEATASSFLLFPQVFSKFFKNFEKRVAFLSFYTYNISDKTPRTSASVCVPVGDFLLCEEFYGQA